MAGVLTGSATTGDLPQFLDAGHSHTSYSLGSTNTWADPQTFIGSTQALPYWDGDTTSTADPKTQLELRARRIQYTPPPPPQLAPAKQDSNLMANPTRRLVKVVIIDPNENMPLDKCVLHNGDEKLTDLNDQELFFEIDIKALLATHNEARTKVRDKKVREREEFLEPAKIRDLKMVVVTVAAF